MTAPLPHRAIAQMGGKARWQKASPEQRRAQMRRLLDIRYGRAPKPEPPKAGQWMQSLFHDWAHYVTNGKPACNAKTPEGMPWHPSSGLRKCTRCMGAVEKMNVKDEGRRTLDLANTNNTL